MDLSSLAVTSISDLDGNSIGIVGVRLVDADWMSMFAEASQRSPQLAVLAAASKPNSTAVFLKGDNDIEYLAVVDNATSAVEPIFVEDAIMYDSISPTQLVQYNFSEDASTPWMVCCLGRDSLESYVGGKFSAWKNQMLTAFGGCAKAFLPEIRRGYALTNIYDHMVFSSPLDEKSDWETEHNGKLVPIPRPVALLRIYNAQSQTYEELSPVLAGSPEPALREEYWISFLHELRDALNPKYGDSFIDDCISMEHAEVCRKYGF